MSSVDVAANPVTAAPIRTVARKNTNKRKAEDLAAAAEANSAPAAAAPASSSAAAVATNTKKPRGSKKAAANTAPVAAPATDADAPAEAKKPRAKKAAKEAAEVVPAPVAAPAVVADTPAAASSTKKTKEPQAPFIEGYGDDEKAEGPELYSDEMYELWRAETRRRVETQTKTKWAKQKKAYRKAQAKKMLKSRKVVRSVKQLDEAATAAKLRARLDTVSNAVFSALDGKWLTTFSFNGLLTAAQLANVDKSTVDSSVLTAIAVYEAAVAKGVRPLGIVSENRKKDGETGEMKYIENVAGERFYIGKKLPYFPAPYKEGSAFVVDKDDKVYVQSAEPATA